jgi:peptidoglycan-associated lipoprotein
MMQNKTILRLLALSASLAFAASCSSTPKQEDGLIEEPAPTAPTDAAGPAADANALGDSDSGKAMGLETIYFPYDSFSLSGKSRATLKANGEILKANPTLRIQVEGHCDSRGGIQYNIALGEKRARAVQSYLTEQGVEADRVSTISYGKERLLDASETEEAHGRNRRANFAVTSR